MLLLWLFGMGAGIANACFTTWQVAPGATVASHFMVAVAAHHDMSARSHRQADTVGSPSHADDAPTHISNLSRADCQKLCDKATVSIPPLKSALDDVQSQPVIAMTAMTVLPMPTLAPFQLQVPRRDGVQAPPIRIAFLRLAL